MASDKFVLQTTLFACYVSTVDIDLTLTGAKQAYHLYFAFLMFSRHNACQWTVQCFPVVSFRRHVDKKLLRKGARYILISSLTFIPRKKIATLKVEGKRRLVCFNDSLERWINNTGFAFVSLIAGKSLWSIRLQFCHRLTVRDQSTSPLSTSPPQA